MRAMAYKLLSSLKSHPLITAFSVLLLFTLPIFHMLVFFWPLIVSTALGVLAVASFGWQSDEHSMPIAGCGTAESGGHRDSIALPPFEEKISNVLMVGNQEVTWLEWLHNEDTQKLCAHERERAAWDAHGYDVCSMVSEASVDAPASTADDKLSVYANGSTCKDEASDDASLDKGRLYVFGSRGEDETPVSALVLTEENETKITSTVIDEFRATAIVLEDVNKDETNMIAPILIAKDETNLDSTSEDQMCRFGSTGKDETAKDATKRNDIAFMVNEESNMHARAYAEGDKDQISVDGLCLTGGGGNECNTTQGSLDSTLHTRNEVNGYASAGGDEVVGIVEALVSTIDSKSTINKCVSARGIECEIHVPVSTLEAQTGVNALGFLSATEVNCHTSEPKIAHTHEQDVLDLPSSNKTISPLSEMNSAEVHEMRHVDEQDKEERGPKQLVTQGPQWDVSDDEEDQSSLRFSFFHNSSLTPSEA